MRRSSICVVSMLLVYLSAAMSFAAERRSPVVQAVAVAGPAVVNIRTEQVVRRQAGGSLFGFSDPLFDQFFQSLVPPRTFRTQSLGSGVIIDQRGYVLTNAHVIDKASKIFVALTDSDKELEASLVGRADFIDLAVLKIEGKAEFPHLAPAKSDDLLLGESVIAIGNPLGLGHSITTGVISAISRRVPMEDKGFSVFIQTDALINPGNSGGPLININGELIGINTAIAAEAQGIGFAIPIEAVKRVLPDLLERGRLRMPYHGMIPAPVDKKFADAKEGGVLVAGIQDASPAAKAGLSFGDVILALDDITVTSPGEMQALLNTYIPGNTVRLKVVRGFAVTEKTMVFSEFPEGYGLFYAREVFGLVTAEGRGGVVVREVVSGGAAEQAGIRKGDLIAEAGGHRVTGVAEFTNVMENHIGFEPLRFLVVRGQKGYYLELP